MNRHLSMAEFDDLLQIMITTTTIGGNLKERRNLILGLIMVSLLAGLAIFIGSCCEDCPTCPNGTEPYKGWLYALDYINEWVYMIDIETDSVVDSVNYETSDSYMPGMLDVSDDGRYLAVGYMNVSLKDQFTRIYDAQTLDVIIDLPDYGLPAFASSENILLGISQGVRIYSIPDFSLIHYDSSSLYGLFDIDEENHLAYITGTTYISSSDSTFIAAYDYVQREIVDQWFLRDSKDSIAIIASYDIHPDGERIYCLTGSLNDGTRVTCYNISDQETLFWINTFSQTGGIKISPDGREVYVTDPAGGIDDIAAPGTVFIYDADDGSYIEGISLYGYGPSVIHPLYASSIAFTPTGERAYIGSGRFLLRSGTISVIDTQTRDIIENIWPDLGHFILKMAVGPKL